jgi:hypothetical protein
MAALTTIEELRTWPGLADVGFEDALAVRMIEAASDAVRLAAGQPAWTRASAPPRARQIAWHLAARSYANPGSVVREGIGPLNEARSEDLATALHLTTAERAELASMSPLANPGDLPGGRQGGVLWVQPLMKSTLVSDGDIVISNVAYAHADDAYAFTPLEA